MSDPLELLLIEDNEYDALLLVHDLRRAGFDVHLERVQTEAEMRAALTSRDWDAIISDYQLPAFSAPAALEVAREIGKDLPFIVVSGTIGEETAVQIMRAGAHDYMMKGNLNRLAEALRREIREAQERREHRKAETALKVSQDRFQLLFERSSDAIFTVDRRTGLYLDANHAAEILTGRKIDEIKKLSIFDVSPKGAADRIEKAAIAKITVEFGEVLYHRPNGSTRTALLSVLPIDENIVFGIAHDITERKQAEDSIRHRAHEMEVLYSTSLRINAQTDLMSLLQTIVEQATNILGVHSGGLYLMEPDGKSLRLVISHNLGASGGILLKLGEGLSGRIAESGEPIMVEDYSAWDGRADIYKNAGFRRTIGAPLRIKGRLIGVITVTDQNEAGLYTPEEVQLFKLFAEQAAIAVENARLFETAQRELAERKQAEIALRESEERYRTIVTGTQVVSFMIDANGIFTLSEGKGLASLGLAPGQVVGMSVEDVYRGHTVILDAVSRALAGETVNTEVTIGEIIFDAIFTPNFAYDGTVQGLIGIANDITERKKSEELLRESERSYRGLFNTVAEAIYIQDKDGCFVDVSLGAIKMYGYPREVFLGKTPAFLAAPGKNDLDAVNNAIQLAFTGKPQKFEFWGQRKNGEVFPKDIRVYKGAYFGKDVVIALALDITERKQAEQAIQRQLDELKILHRVAMICIQVSTIDELIENVTEAVSGAFNFDNFGVLLLSEQQEILRPHPSYRGTTEPFPKLVSLEDGVAGQVIKSGQALRVGDVTKLEKYVMITADIRSELCVPIKIAERPIGVVNAESKELDFFTDGHERLVLTLAGQLATAMERIRLFDAERKRRREAETLREAIAALSSSLELDQVLEVILTSIEQVVPFDSAAVFLLEGDRLRGVIARGIPEMQELLSQSYPADNLLFMEARNSGKLVILDDAQSDTRFQGWGGTAYVRGWMGIPLIVHAELLGYITLDNREVAAYGDEDASLVQAFANQAATAIQNARLYEGIQNSLKEMNRAYETTIEGWSRAMDLRDHETEGHTLRVTAITLQLAEALGLNEEELVHVRRGALLHDMGKMGVPDRILLKPDKLTDEEWTIMRMHPQYAYEMLAPIDYLRPALDIPYAHHERWDGSGYPRGLKGEEIPIVARIFSVVDVWDALTSDRPYRLAWSKLATFEYLQKNINTQFDPRVVAEFSRLIEQGKV